MEYKIDNEQILNEFDKLHKAIHRLLYFKEEGYEHLDSYFESVMRRTDGFLTLIDEKSEIVPILSILQSARNEAAKDNDCNFKVYRKLVFDIHNLLDEIKTKRSGGGG